MTEEETSTPQGEIDAGGSVREVLLGMGVSEASLDRAEREGTLPLLAIERLVLPEPAAYDLTALAQETGMSATQIAQLWRSLGFAEPVPGERLFTHADADMLRTVAELIADGLIDPALAVQMSRVIGSSLARVASAQVEAIDPDDRADDDSEDEVDGAAACPGRRGAGDVDAERARRQEEFGLYAGVLLPTLPKVMDYVWRRHLQAAARQRLNQEGAGANRDRAVGFADLVGFTALSQQISPRQLAAVVDRFETIAYDTVAQLGGLVVKMIGDEVMFSVDEAKPAVLIALTLAEAYAQDDDLSDVRVGLACGPVLQREADLFGPVVNLASRIVGIAFPASVVVAESVHDALVDDPDFAWKSIGRRRLKDIGRVPLWVAHWGGSPIGPKTPSEQARARQAERREKAMDD